jgi:serine/threonine-protein kinase
MSYISRKYSVVVPPDVGGTVFPQAGPWRLIERLGSGTWAEVYRAQPAGLSDDGPADYAVKVAKPNSYPEGMAIQLLRREAVVGHRISHEHLACVLSSHVRRFPFYVVMPYMEGETIEAALSAAKTLSVAQAMGVARQTAEGMNALHETGWIHSDIKPGNIHLAPSGHVTLLDLGLARRIDRRDSGGALPLAGTLAYTAPEAFSSLVDLGPASDVYSLGVTLYELLTGARPFPETDPAVLAASHIHRDPPDPRSRNPHLSGDVVRLLRRMLDKQPDRRPDFSELAGLFADLEEVAGEAFPRRLAA